MTRPQTGGITSAIKARRRIAIVGSGFAGIAMAIRLKDAGITSFTIYEQAAGIGGTWRDNTYPGAACDVPSQLYSFSFEPDPDWSRSFGGQREILAYLERCVERHGLRPFIQFNAEVIEARFDAARQLWQLEIGGIGEIPREPGTTRSSRQVEAECVIAASGPLSRPALPAVPGLAAFKGKLFHSARWDHDYRLEGKTVAVIGTGASAIQFVPQIAPRVATLQVFQRTAPWLIPKPDHATSAPRRWVFRHLPFTQRLARQAIYWQLEMRALGFIVNPALMKLPARLALRHLRKAIADPVLRSKLTPHYTMGCKRILLSNDYYPALTRPNVELITTGISAVTETGILCDDERHYPVDAIICGTGFQVNDVGAPFAMTGLNGASLGRRWLDEGPQAYLGSAISDFPNLFMIVGPNTGLGHNSMIYMIESQVTYIAACLRALEQRNARSMHVRRTIQDEFNARVQHAMQHSVWTSGCHSWYLTKSGKNTALWPGFTFQFKNRTREVDPDDYHFVP
jgi:cation diffusion facilitator CzcD-associated flavoprotein CzcO